MTRDARKRLNAIARENADGFESTICHNVVYDSVQGQHEHAGDLEQLLTVCEDAYGLADRFYSRDDEVWSAAFGAAEDLNGHIDTLVEETIADTLATLLGEVDDWTDSWDEAEIEAAKHEAREWLQEHHEVAERVGVFEEVEA